MNKGQKLATMNWEEAQRKLGEPMHNIRQRRNDLGERNLDDGLSDHQFCMVRDSFLADYKQECHDQAIGRLTRRNIELRNEVAYRVHPFKSMVTALIGVVIGGLIVWIAMKGGVV